MAVDFYLTRMGHKFYEGDVPRISRSLERIADALEKLNARETVVHPLPWTPAPAPTPPDPRSLLEERPRPPLDPIVMKETK